MCRDRQHEDNNSASRVIADESRYQVLACDNRDHVFANENRELEQNVMDGKSVTNS